MVVAYKTLGNLTRRPLRVVTWVEEGLSGERAPSVEGGEFGLGGGEIGVTVFVGVIVVGFWVMGLFRESFDVSSTKAALRRSMLTTSSLPFRRMVNVLSDRLSTLKGPS